MKKLLFIALVGVIAFTACDKVDNPFPQLPPTDLDFDLYPNGGQAEYEANEWPTFSANTNTDRNVLIEDYTGHKCNSCPFAAVIAHDIEVANPDRAFVSAVHTGPNGAGNLQAVSQPIFVEDFTCDEGEAIGVYFGVNWPGSPFFGNPSGTVSRVDGGSGAPVSQPSTWSTIAANLLSANDLKVNLQSEANYFSSTRGLFVHVEAEVLDQALTNELRMVVQFHEDSMVAPQAYPGFDSLTYVHKDVMRGCIDGRAFGQALDASRLGENGKYYFDYSYKVPDKYDAEHCHLLIYIRDAVTEEVYHVIKQEIED